MAGLLRDPAEPVHLAGMKSEPRPSWPEIPWLVLVVIGSTLFFFRRQVTNGFTMLFGNSFDAVISVAIEEHWLAVLRGEQIWNRPPWFTPYTDTLGYNDGLLLFGPPYALLRCLGVDPFMSAELANIGFHMAGVAAFFSAARLVFGFGPQISLIGTILFGIAGNLILQGDHAQLFSISLFPVLLLLIWRALTLAGAGRRRQAAIWGCSAALLFDGWLLTSFYAAWLSGFLLGLQAVALIGRSAAIRTRPQWLEAALAVPFAITAAIGFIGLLPFLVTYLPKANETGLHDASIILAYQPRLVDLVNPHLLGGLLAGPWHWLEPRSSPGSVDPTGFAPLLLLSALLGGIVTLRTRVTTSCEAARRSVAVSLPIALVLLVMPAGWHLVLDLVPGARGLRDIARLLLVMTMPMVLLAMCGLEWMSARLVTRNALAAPLLAMLLIVEELATPIPVALDRRAESRLLQSVPPTPEGCRSFCITGYDRTLGSALDGFEARQNVDAMLLSAVRSLPTLNGFATFNPPDGDFTDVNSHFYRAAVGRYVSAHDLGYPCELNLTTSSWQREPRLPMPIVPVGTDVPLGADNSTGYGVFLSGWDPQEPNGRWTNHKRSELRFILPDTSIVAPLTIALTMSSLAWPGGDFDAVEVLVNGITRAHFEIDSRRRLYTLRVPPRSGGDGHAILVDLLQSRLRTPASIGLSHDKRQLGLFLSNLRIAIDAMAPAH